MVRGFPHTHLCHGHLVGFSVKIPNNEPTYRACFRSPDGRRFKRDTNPTRMGQAVEAARLIIDEVFAPPSEQPEKVTWDQAVERLTKRLGTSGNRSGTLGYYLKCLRLVHTICSATDGPADISPSVAAAWRDEVMSKPTRRKQPSAHYVAGLLGYLAEVVRRGSEDPHQQPVGRGGAPEGRQTASEVRHRRDDRGLLQMDRRAVR